MVDEEGARELADAAAIHAAMNEIDAAIGHLAASPLDVRTAEQMRAVLASTRLAKAREAVRRGLDGRVGVRADIQGGGGEATVSRSGRGRLKLVSGAAGDSTADDPTAGPRVASPPEAAAAPSERRDSRRGDG